MPKFTVISGMTYRVEAETEEEALQIFYDWYDGGWGPKSEELDELVETIEVLSMVID